jgi:hypothetical protein
MCFVLHIFLKGELTNTIVYANERERNPHQASLMTRARYMPETEVLRTAPSPPAGTLLHKATIPIPQLVGKRVHIRASR